MNKFVLATFLSLMIMIIFSSTVLASSPWTQPNWEDSTTTCGDYNTNCDDCQSSNPTTVSEEYYTYADRLPKGTWLVKISAENIQALETKCCSNAIFGCAPGNDCSVEITEIGIKLKVDDQTISGLDGKQTGSWLKIGGDNCVESTGSKSINPIYSSEIKVVCNNDNGCQMK